METADGVKAIEATAERAISSTKDPGLGRWGVQATREEDCSLNGCLAALKGRKSSAAPAKGKVTSRAPGTGTSA